MQRELTMAKKTETKTPESQEQEVVKHEFAFRLIMTSKPTSLEHVENLQIPAGITPTKPFIADDGREFALSVFVMPFLAQWKHDHNSMTKRIIEGHRWMDYQMWGFDGTADEKKAEIARLTEMTDNWKGENVLAWGHYSRMGTWWFSYETLTMLSYLVYTKPDIMTVDEANILFSRVRPWKNMDEVRAFFSEWCLLPKPSECESNEKFPEELWKTNEMPRWAFLRNLSFFVLKDGKVVCHNNGKIYEGYLNALGTEACLFEDTAAKVLEKLEVWIKKHKKDQNAEMLEVLSACITRFRKNPIEDNDPLCREASYVIIDKSLDMVNAIPEQVAPLVSLMV